MNIAVLTNCSLMCEALIRRIWKGLSAFDLDDNMDSEANPIEVLSAESQRLEAFADFWRRRYVPLKVVT